MFYVFKNVIWTTIDAVWEWFILAYNKVGLSIESLAVGAVLVTLFIGYVLSPYLRNPLRGFSKENKGGRNSR